MAAPAFEQGSASTNGNLHPETVVGAGDTEWEWEWDYEYDENETENYYFTLDVTTHQTGQSVKARNSKNKVQRRNGRKNDAGPDGTVANPTTTSTAATPNNTSTPQPNSVASSREDRRLQVLDLHTANPLIMLDGQLYSCHWSTERCSQFYVARPGIAEDPLRPGHVLDIVDISRARLVGRPAVARPRKVDTTTQIGASVENAITIDEDDNDEDEDEDEDVDIVADTPSDVLLQDAPSSTQRFARERQKAKGSEAKAQASFLERFSAIKEKKGETNKIPIYGVKQYEPPSNKDEIRERAMATDAERGKNTAPATGRNRKRGPYKPRQSSSIETITPAP